MTAGLCTRVRAWASYLLWFDRRKCLLRVEFLMGYYPILNRIPKGRDEGDASQTWIRRHDEYA